MNNFNGYERCEAPDFAKHKCGWGNMLNFIVQSQNSDSFYKWIKDWVVLIEDNKQRCIRCGKEKELTSRIENMTTSPDCTNINIYKEARNLKANLCLNCYNELEEIFINVQGNL